MVLILYLCTQEPQNSEIMKQYSHDYTKEDEDPWDKDWHQMEQEVVKLFKEGRPFSEIAAKTGAATQTVKDITSAPPKRTS